MYPPKPVRSEVKSEVKSDVSNTSAGSSTSEPIDLTLDDDDVKVAAKKILSASSQSSSSDGNEDSGTGLSAEEDIVSGILRDMMLCKYSDQTCT